jgi:TM2 domain-containing membrane protein YozV
MEQPESTLPVQVATSTAIEPQKPEKKTGDVFCRQCGEPIFKESEICPKCGVRQKSDKSPGTAAVLSFLIVGMGQIYNGEVGKGILFFFVQCINALLLFVVIGFLTVPAFWIYAIYDAYNTAKIMNGGN